MNCSLHPYDKAVRQPDQPTTTFDVRGIVIGGGDLVVIAGPCSVESEEQIHRVAEAVAHSGAQILRGGCFKPRSSPYSFQGLGERGLRYLQAAGEAHGLATISEVMDTEKVELVADYVDILQIGSRNMQNFSLLKRVGQLRKPVLLKRGFSATYEDLLMAAEYLLEGGNEEVILCERGIRTFEGYTRNTLDIAAIPALRQLTHLPIAVDPSHGTGLRHLVPPMACAGAAVGADLVMVEVDFDPDCTLCDGQQTLDPSDFASLMTDLRKVELAIK